MNRDAEADLQIAQSGRVRSSGRSMQLSTYRLLSGAGGPTVASRAVAVLLGALILANVVAAVLETVESLRQPLMRAFEVFEWFSVAVFTSEYLLRLWVCTVDDRYRHWFVGRVRFAMSPLMIIDLFAILPFYAASVVKVDLRTLRAVRLVRLLRVLKIARYSEALQSLGRVLILRRGELFITLLAVTVLLVISSTLMYYVEREAQPEQFSSIPAAMWWSVETLTTIGYGDMLPVTVAGKIINSFIALLGIGVFALPAGILGSGFVEQLRNRSSESPSQCPKCGHRFHDETRT